MLPIISNILIGKLYLSKDLYIHVFLSEEHVITAPNTHKIVSYRLPAPTILKTSTCSAEKIFHNVTLIGGMKAANITSLGKASNMQECIGMSCDYGQGDLVLMLEKNCYTVKCVNERVCQTAPAQPSKFFSRVAYLKWGSTINETGLEFFYVLVMSSSVWIPSLVLID